MQLRTLLQTFSTKDLSSKLDCRQHNLIQKIDFVIDTLESAKLDIFYMERLKLPLTTDEQIYFVQQVDKINGAIQILLWMRKNMMSKNRFWRYFL